MPKGTNKCPGCGKAKASRRPLCHDCIAREKQIQREINQTYDEVAKQEPETLGRIK